MFGLGTFGTLTFAQRQSAAGNFYNTVTTDALTVTDAIGATVILVGICNDTLTLTESITQITSINVAVNDSITLIEQQNSIAILIGNSADALTLLDLTDFNQTLAGEFHLVGSATVQFVGTTKFIDMIEQNKASLAISAELSVRSL